MNRNLSKVGAVIVVLIAVMGAFLIIDTYNSRPDSDLNGSISSPPIQNNSNAEPEEAPAGEPITVTGTIECLLPRETDGPQNASCAIGLKQDDGKSYALSSQDPMKISGLPTGQRVEISGILSPLTSQELDAEGVIYVETVERL